MDGNLASIAMMDLAQTRFTPDPDNQESNAALGLLATRVGKLCWSIAPASFRSHEPDLKQRQQRKGEFGRL